MDEEKIILIYQNDNCPPEGHILENGKILLLEKVFTEKNSCVKIWINSKESTHHHRPHVHASFNKDKEYSISIDEEIKVLSKNEDKFSTFIIKAYITNDLLQTTRMYWNTLPDVTYKFKQDKDGIYIPNNTN